MLLIVYDVAYNSATSYGYVWRRSSTYAAMKSPVKIRSQMNLVVLGSAILLGVTLLVSGTGKLPGQTEFIDALLKSFWTPSVAYFVGYCVPWVEIGLGVCLLLGVLPRIAAALCLPLIVGFMANNSWALIHGVVKFPECGYCFGIWEEFLGALSPLGALVLDIVLLGLALIVLLLHQERFLTFRPWFIRQKKGGRAL